MSSSRDNQGSTRLPPLPMPSFPKFNQSSYQPNKMTYDELAHFRYMNMQSETLTAFFLPLICNYLNFYHTKIGFKNILKTDKQKTYY